MSPAVKELKHKLKLKNDFNYGADYHNLILNGVNKSIIEKVTNLLGLNKKEMLKLLPISDTHLRRKKNKLSSQTTEHILSIAEVAIVGYDLFTEPKDFKEWLYEENVVLDNQKPFEYLSTIHGCEKIRVLLQRAAHGIPA